MKHKFLLTRIITWIWLILLASCQPADVSESTPLASPSSSPTVIWVVGDLGWGRVTGHVNDAITGEPIPGAIVTCEHFSYKSPALCQGSTTTDANGDFVFEYVFFHDTDRMTIRAEAPNFVSQTYTQEFFTQPEFYTNLYLMPFDVTPMICCTPPACSTNEAYYCPGECPCGCGTTCATKTATPTPLSFVCVDCEFESALEAICPLASGEETIRELLIPYGEVQSEMADGHSCLYVSTFDGNWGYLYYVDEATLTVKFVVINPNLLTPSPTLDPNSPTPYTHLPDITETPTWTPTPP
jgi:hypothetical protein